MTEEPDDTTRARPQRAGFDLRRPQVRVGAVLAVALLVGFVVWLVVRGGSDDETTGPSPTAAKPVLVSGSGLRTIASNTRRPIYWAGPKPDLKYELTKTSDGRVWLRYLPADADIGERDKPYLTVGTYPVANAYAVTSAAARRDGVRLRTRDGAIAFYVKKHPTNVYLAYPNSDYQIEVFEPSASAVQELVKRGEIATIVSKKPAPAGAAPVAVSEAGLKQIAAKADGPIYWVGPEQGVKYEVTQVPDERVYVRYLPAGVPTGSTTQYLTIGTYAVKNAVAATKTAATSVDAETIDIGGGGFAFYNKSSPTNVHLAYPGVDYQIEVFDPSPKRAHELVSSGRLTTVH